MMSVRPREPLVSVITPVFNTGKYLAECIESVLTQTYGNWEYVIVNNKSTDDSLSIAESYAVRDSRIRVVTTDRFLPVNKNHNFALRQISPFSTYCKVVQADDWIFPECLEKMVSLAETDERVAIVGAYALAGRSVRCHGLECSNSAKASSIIPGREACRQFFLRNCYVFGTATSVLYRSALIRARDPFYVESSNHGDSEVCFDVLDGRMFGFIHQVLTFTRVGNESITTSVKDFNPGELHAYIVTTKYGQRYLSPEEYKMCRRRVDRVLYTALARSVFRRRGRAYWNYQSQWLAAAGLEFDRARVRRMQIPRILQLLGNPVATAKSLYHHFIAGEHGE
jgi:glycosyltransferase involved in cell wall biosynthesis